MRNVVLHYSDAAEFLRALNMGDRELELPAVTEDGAYDGEWVLVLLEIGDAGLGTAAAARTISLAAGGRGRRRSGNPPRIVLTFEDRDWERLLEFARANEAGVVAADADVLADDDRPTKPSIGVEDTPCPPSSEPNIERTPRTPAPSAPGSTDSGRAWNKHARVLLVDDESEIREVVCAMLDAVGLVVEAATSGEEALERMREDSYDLVVLDWNLPGITGVELCRLMRKDPSLSSLPVLFLTAHVASRDLVDAFASGADDYVTKPFRAPELGARIFSLLRRSAHPRAVT